jgi:hypothetical protein
MKFLVDRCAGRKLAEWLRGQGHDVLESQSLGPDARFFPSLLSSKSSSGKGWRILRQAELNTGRKSGMSYEVRLTETFQKSIKSLKKQYCNVK